MESFGSIHLAAEASSRWSQQRLCSARRAGLKGKETYLWHGDHHTGLRGLQPFPSHLRGGPEQRAAGGGLEGAQAGSIMVQRLGVICANLISSFSPSLSERMPQRQKMVQGLWLLRAMPASSQGHFPWENTLQHFKKQTLGTANRVLSLIWSLVGEGQNTRLKGRKSVSLSQ